jgi:hypothetical protein
MLKLGLPCKNSNIKSFFKRTPLTYRQLHTFNSHLYRFTWAQCNVRFEFSLDDVSFNAHEFPLVQLAATCSSFSPVTRACESPWKSTEPRYWMGHGRRLFYVKLVVPSDNAEVVKWIWRHWHLRICATKATQLIATKLLWYVAFLWWKMIIIFYDVLCQESFIFSCNYWTPRTSKRLCQSLLPISQ